MRVIRFTTTLDKPIEQLPELAPLLGKRIEMIVFDAEPSVSASPTQLRPRRKAGSLKGRIWMSPDFDEPLEEFKEYME